MDDKQWANRHTDRVEAALRQAETLLTDLQMYDMTDPVLRAVRHARLMVGELRAEIGAVGKNFTSAS